jgi:hypothetical protein
MKKNIHPNERALRVTVGIAMIAIALFGNASPWFFLGIVPLMTGLIGWCPPYAIFGINTCNIGKK